MLAVATGPQVYADQGSTIVASETANTNMKSYKMEVNVDGCQGRQRMATADVISLFALLTILFRIIKQ